MQTYDDIVIGSGPVAYAFTNALWEQASSRRVLVVDQDLFGGTCPNYGCEPKIFLEGAVRSVLIARQLQQRGIAQPATIDWSQLMATKRATFQPYPANAQAAMGGQFVDTLQGRATFMDDRTIQVNDQTYTAARIIIATGQTARRLAIPGSDLTHTSNDVLDLPELPRRVIFIGGGYVSMELATVLNAAGADVQIIEHGAQPLGAFYGPHVDQVVRQMTDRGIRFALATDATAVTQIGTTYRVTTRAGQSYDADYVVDATGRVPNVAGLHLERTGVHTTAHGIVADDHLRTAVPGIFAAGDVLAKDPQVAPALTPVAQFEGTYLAENTGQAISYPVTATGSFTFPQVAQVGVPVAAAQEDAQLHLKTLDLAQDFAYAGTNDQNAELIGVFDQRNRLVGAAEVSQTATDDINLLTSVIGLSLDAQAWKTRQIYVFPTLATKLKDFL